MRIAILMANTDESDFAHRHPKDGEKFAALMRLARPEWDYPSYAVKDGVFPENPDTAQGYIITGSPASVNEDQPWMQQLESFVRDLAQAEKPVFGACFGHQIIAKALGGRVGDNPKGWVKGAVTARYTKSTIAGYASHTQQVLEPPRGAHVIASSPDCPVAALQIGKTIETTQYHPEMTPDFFAALLDEYGPSLPAGVEAAARASMEVVPDRAIWAERMARFFENAVASQAVT